MYDEWFITMFNLVYTALPVLGMSLFDQVNSEKESSWYNHSESQTELFIFTYLLRT